MIVNCYKDEEGIKTFRTTGCGCCSIELRDNEEDRDDIIDYLKSNVSVIYEACELLDIDADEFINENKP
jgi:hypothetical protein